MIATHKARSRVRTYIAEKSNIIFGMQKVVTDVFKSLDDDVQAILDALPDIELSKVAKLDSALKLSKGVLTGDIPKAAHPSLRSAVTYYTQCLGGGKINSDYAWAEDDNELREVLRAEFVMSDWKDKVRRKFRVPLRQNVLISKTLRAVKIGTNAYRDVDQWTHVTIPLANNLELNDLREFAPLFHSSWDEVLNAAKWRREWFTDNT